jgi:pseudouridine kinase
MVFIFCSLQISLGLSPTMSNLLIIGGAHVDRLARLKGPHWPQTSNPVRVIESVGGGGLNAGRAARRLNVNVAMLSARGGDTGGAMVEQAIAASGMTDLSSVHLDRATASYTAILEPGGDLVTAIADMDLYETAIARSYKRAPVQKAAALADAILCDANLSPLGLQGIFAEIAHGKPVYALAISAGKIERFAGLLPNLACLFMNSFEAAALTGLPEAATTIQYAQALHALGLSRAVVSAGGEPAAFLDGEKISLIRPPKVNVVDVTGAGDCLAGTMIAALLGGASFIKAAKLGLAGASITASRQGASPDIARAEIEALVASNQWIMK